MTLDQIMRRLEPLHYGRYEPRQTRATIAAWEGRRPTEQRS